MMQSVAEHLVALKEDAVVKPVKGRKKRHRGRKPAAGRRGEPKELTRGDCGYGRKLAAVCRKVSSFATVARHRKNAVRKIGTQGNCGTRSKLTAAGIKMTHHARVAWRRENFARKDCTRAKDERATQGVWRLRKNLRMHHEGKCGKKDLCGGQPLYLRKERTTTNASEGGAQDSDHIWEAKERSTRTYMRFSEEGSRNR
jgi:hypothetical protein